jgi:hypothetical protein
VKQCPTCGREIAQQATVCESCEAWAAALVQTRPADDDFAEFQPPSEADPPAAVRTAPSAAPAAPRRHGLVMAVSIAAVAVIAIAIGFARGGSAPNASAAPAAAPAPAPAAAASAPAAPAGVQRWSTENQASWVGNRRRAAAFELPAENVVKTWFGPMRPLLIVRCTAGAIEAFVFTGSPMKIEPRAEGKTVTVSVDGEPVHTERWPDSDNHDALFAPDPAAFTARLRQARTLRFGYSPHNSSDVVAEFSVSGLDPLIGAASKQCAAPPRK